MTLEDLGESLFADVTEEKKTAIDIIFSPIIKLRARGKTGRQAAMLANVWAAVFLDVYGNLVRTNAQRNLDFWSSATERLRSERAVKLEEIRKFRLGYNLEFLQEWLDEASVDFRELQDDLNRRQLEVDQETSRIVSLTRALEAVEDNGTWIGATTVSAPVEKPGVTERFREMRQNVIASAERVDRLTQRLDAFNDRHNLDVVRAEAERALYDLVDYRSHLKEVTVKADQTSKTLAGVLKNLDATEPKIAVEQPGDEGPGEIVNPAWEELQYERIRLEVARDEAVAAREKLATYVGQLAGEAEELAARRSRLELEHDQLRNNLDLALEEYNGYQQAYGDLKREIYNAAQNIGPLQSRAQHLAQATGELNARIEDTMTSITNGQTGLSLRESEDETWEEYVKLASENLREAELAAERTSLDVYVSAEAIPPTRKIWPQRTLMVIVMTFLGFFVAIAWVCGRYYLVSTGLLTR
jgi:chromosome segregation ATPase